MILLVKISLKNRFFSQYLDRCGKYERAIDSRMKEIRMAYHEIHDDPHVHNAKKPRRREHKKKEKHSEKEKEKNKDKDKDKNKNKERRRSRISRIRKSIPKISIPEFTKAEADYFHTVEEVKFFFFFFLSFFSRKINIT